MKNYFKKSKGFILTLLIPLLVISIVLATSYNKAIFVYNEGSIKIFNWPSILLAISLLFKWKYARPILRVLVILAIVGTLIAIIWLSNEFILSYIVLFIVLAILAYLLIFSRPIDDYLDEETSNL